MIIIQHIQTQWSKLSRGMPAAQLRQAIAPVFALPDTTMLEGRDAMILLHHVTAYEHSNFTPEQQVEYLTAGNYWSFDFRQSQYELAVYFKEDCHYHGQPHHAGQPKLLCQLKRNQMAILKINGRFSREEGHLYQQHIVNLAWVQQVDSNLFVSTKPVIVIDKTVDLF